MEKNPVKGLFHFEKKNQKCTFRFLVMLHKSFYTIFKTCNFLIQFKGAERERVVLRQPHPLHPRPAGEHDSRHLRGAVEGNRVGGGHVSLRLWQVSKNHGGKSSGLFTLQKSR